MAARDKIYEPILKALDNEMTKTGTAYQALLKQIFPDYAALLNRRPQPDVETEVVIDEERGQYILHTLGWKDKARIWNTPLYVRLHNGKIWVETDWIEEGITEKLLAAGVPKEAIVLAFQHPSMRPLTEFAVA
jgi:hypothetical protein